LRTQSIVNVVSSLLENVKADEVIKEWNKWKIK
jgi:hypothetical protein